MSGDMVRYKNELNSIPLKKFNAKEMDLFFSLCAKLKNKHQETIVLSFEDLKSLSNYKITALKHFIYDLENVYRKMLQLTYRTETDEKINYFVLFQDFSIDKVKKNVEISVNPKLEYILNELSREFTQFELTEFTSLASGYSKTMYRLLKQYKSTGFYTVKLDTFRDLLDIPNSYKMGNIDQQVLKLIKKELSEYFDSFKIKKIKAKKGNKIDRLEFTFLEKMEAEPQGKIPKVSLHNWLED